METKRHRVEYIKTSLIESSETYSLMTDEAFKSLQNNLITWGQLKPINVYQHGETYRVIDGIMILRALKSVGSKYALTMVHEPMSTEKAYLLGLSLNLIAGEKDYLKISAALSTLPKHEVHRYLPFDSDVSDDLIKLTTYDWKKFSEVKDDENQLDLFM